MADFVSGKRVVTMDDYNLYTHYVAGLVGLGLTGLFVASGLENPKLENQDKIANEMGLFLQKVNILKDFLTDVNEGRLFWPEAVWKLYVPEGAGVEALAKPENLDRALACLNHLCADALDLVPSCLDYMSLLKNQSVFQFAAIPQVLIIGTLAHLLFCRLLAHLSVCIIPSSWPLQRYIISSTTLFSSNKAATKSDEVLP